jgi:hypothetical protein
MPEITEVIVTAETITDGAKPQVITSSEKKQAG